MLCRFRTSAYCTKTTNLNFLKTVTVYIQLANDKNNIMEKQKNAVGRRKEAVTRVFLSKGDGNITINGKDYKTYFPLVYLQNQVEAPLKLLKQLINLM